jgi:transcriptional regulator with XRE-family HTH domain
MTQRAVAAEAGVTRGSVSMIENGSRSAQTQPIVEALARALGVSPAEFVVNYPESGRHRAALRRLIAEAPHVDAEQVRRVRSLLAAPAASARQERELGEPA